MNIVAFDPGKMTGWATFSDNPDYVAATGEHRAGEMPWYEAIHWYETLCEDGAKFETVVESFIITAETLKKSRQHWSLESIGAMRYLHKRYAISGGFHLQSPAEAKAFATNDKLKKMDWYTVGQDHARDASRHLLVFAVKNKLIPLDKLL